MSSRNVIRGVFAEYLPAEQVDSYIAGLIILAAAPCTAMVFVWSNLCDGEPNFTLSQVALNDTIMVFAFAPIVGLLLGLSSIVVPWDTLLLSVVLYIVLPVILAAAWRRRLTRGEAGERRLTWHGTRLNAPDWSAESRSTTSPAFCSSSWRARSGVFTIGIIKAVAPSSRCREREARSMFEGRKMQSMSA